LEGSSDRPDQRPSQSIQVNRSKSINPSQSIQVNQSKSINPSQSIQVNQSKSNITNSPELTCRIPHGDTATQHTERRVQSVFAPRSLPKAKLNPGRKPGTHKMPGFSLTVLTDWQAEMRLILSSNASMSRMPCWLFLCFLRDPPCAVDPFAGDINDC
jgi:hypothetical protein